MEVSSFPASPPLWLARGSRITVPFRRSLEDEISSLLSSPRNFLIWAPESREASARLEVWIQSQIDGGVKPLSVGTNSFGGETSGAYKRPQDPEARADRVGIYKGEAPYRYRYAHHSPNKRRSERMLFGILNSLSCRLSRAALNSAPPSRSPSQEALRSSGRCSRRRQYGCSKRCR